MVRMKFNPFFLTKCMAEKILFGLQVCEQSECAQQDAINS